MNYGVAHDIHTTFFKAEIFFKNMVMGLGDPRKSKLKTINTLWTNDFILIWRRTTSEADGHVTDVIKTVDIINF